MSANEQNNDSFSPFSSNVKERDYTKPLVDSSIVDIPEAEFTPPSVEDLKEGLKSRVEENDLGGIKLEKEKVSNPAGSFPNPSGSDGTPKVTNKSQERISVNPAMSELDDSDKRRAAKTLVEAGLDGYGRLNSLAANLVKFPMRKIKRMQREGQIDLSIPLKLEDGTAPIGNFMEQYNSTMDGILEVSDDFKKKVTPVAIRVAMKYNAGMSDELLLGYYLAMDVAVKSSIIYQLRQQTNDLLEDFIEMSSIKYKTQGPSHNATEPKGSAHGPIPPDQTPPPQSGPENFNPNTSEKNTAQAEPAQSDAKREFFEPEEKVSNTETYQEPIESKTASPGETQAEEPKIIVPNKTKRGNKMPTFGDQEILREMEEIAKKSGKNKNKH